MCDVSKNDLFCLCLSVNVSVLCVSVSVRERDILGTCVFVKWLACVLFLFFFVLFDLSFRTTR